MVENIIKIMGRRAVKILMFIPGISSSVRTVGFTKSFKGVALTFLMVRENHGPATVIAGMAMIIPYKSVFPISASNMAVMAVGAG